MVMTYQDLTGARTTAELQTRVIQHEPEGEEII